MTTLEDKLKFCQLVEPDKRLCLSSDIDGYYRENSVCEYDWMYVETVKRKNRKILVKIYDKHYVESLCMRWLIDNQDKDTGVIFEDTGYSLTVSEYFDVFKDISVGNIIELALLMDKNK